MPKPEQNKFKRLFKYLGEHLATIVTGVLSTLIAAYLTILLFDKASSKNINTEKPKPVNTDSSFKDHPVTNRDTVNESSNKKKPESIHRSDLDKKIIQFDFVVVMLPNQSNNSTSSQISKWIKSNGTSSEFSITNIVMSQNNFDKIENRTQTDLQNTVSTIKAKYLCMFRYDVSYEPSELNSSLIVANGIYHLTIIENGTAKMVYSEEKQISAAEISKERAKTRIETLYFDYLKEQSFTL